MIQVLELIKKYWPIKNFSQKLSDGSVAAFQAESADAFYEQMGRVHARIMAKPDISPEN